MTDDLRPAGGPAKSLQTKLNSLSKTKPTSKSFKTPEEVAAADDLALAAAIAKKTSPQPVNAAASQPANQSWIDRWRDKLHLHFQWPPGQKEWLASLIIIVVCGSLVALVLSHFDRRPAALAAKPHKAHIVKPTTVPSTLTGLPVDPSLNKRTVTGVMIENSLDARPQSGLSQAGVVFEAIAEGGITRFLALFQDTAPENVGPIRSARIYYVQWSMGFDAGYAHVGGSPEAIDSIRAWGVRDLDQFYNGDSYHRVGERAAPHNVYTGIGTLNQLEAGKGYTTSTYSGFLRKKAAPAKVPTAKTIDISISGPSFGVHYDYNPATNTYNRSEGGAAHIDANTNQQISPAVVVAMVVPYGIQEDGYHSSYAVNGTGQAYIFQNGTATLGTWTKTSEKSQITFADAAGKPLGLNPGQTWITAIDSLDKASSAP